MMEDRLIADIDSSESCKLVAYKDSEGLWTIGWGHQLFPQGRDWTGTTWTQAQADAQRGIDIDQARTFAQALLEWPYLDTPCRQNALIELVFEMKRRWLPFVNTRACIRAKDWQGAHDNVLKSLWATQVHKTRADRIANYLLTGVYP